MVALWGRAPELDIEVTASAIRTMYSTELPVVGARRITGSTGTQTSRRVAYVTDTVTVSGATNVVIYILGNRKLVAP